MDTHYSVLGISESASPRDIKRAYRQKLRTSHPDVAGGSNEAFRKVQAAWETLSDPQSRSDYDLSLSAPKQMPIFVPPSPVHNPYEYFQDPKRLRDEWAEGLLNPDAVRPQRTRSEEDEANRISFEREQNARMEAKRRGADYEEVESEEDYVELPPQYVPVWKDTRGSGWVLLIGIAALILCHFLVSIPELKPYAEWTDRYTYRYISSEHTSLPPIIAVHIFATALAARFLWVFAHGYYRVREEKILGNGLLIALMSGVTVLSALFLAWVFVWK